MGGRGALYTSPRGWLTPALPHAAASDLCNSMARVPTLVQHMRWKSCMFVQQNKCCMIAGDICRDQKAKYDWRSALTRVWLTQSRTFAGCFLKCWPVRPTMAIAARASQLLCCELVKSDGCPANARVNIDCPRQMKDALTILLESILHSRRNRQRGTYSTQHDSSSHECQQLH